MGREVRRVPPTWEHPKKTYPRRRVGEELGYIPLLDGSYTEAFREWQEGLALWLTGLRRDWGDKEKLHEHGEPRTIWKWVEWHGGCPQPEDYMPEWSAEERTGWQMYENVSEGTPISPVMNSPELLARWLADNDANAGAGHTATYEQWLATIRAGSAPSMVISGGRMQSGVAFMESAAPSPEPRR